MSLPLKLLADENIPKPLVEILRKLEIDVVWIVESLNRGISDLEVVNIANKLSRTILTRDLDFLQYSLASKANHGIIYIGEPITKDNINSIATDIKNVVSRFKLKKKVIIVKSGIMEVLY